MMESFQIIDGSQKFCRNLDYASKLMKILHGDNLLELITISKSIIQNNAFSGMSVIYNVAFRRYF